MSVYRTIGPLVSVLHEQKCSKAGLINHANSSCFKYLLTSCQEDEIDISCPIFVSPMKYTLSPHISVIGHSKMELTDVHFSFQKFHWLFESNETFV